MQTSQSTFRFGELSDSAQEKARHNYIEHWVHDGWHEWAIDETKSGSVEQGFEIDEVYYSGFWSQGDGASWTGSVYLPDFIKYHVKDSLGASCWLWLIEDDWIHNRVSINRQGNYCHEMTMSVSSIESYLDGHNDEPLETDCILKGAPINTIYDLIQADNNCEVRSYDALEQLILDKAREFARHIYRTLENAYEAEISYDNISEVYDANEILFNEEGEIV